MNLKKLKSGDISFSYTLPEEDLKIAKKYGMKGKVFRGKIKIFFIIQAIYNWFLSLYLIS